MTHHYQVSSDVHLVHHTVSKVAPKVTAPAPTDHILIIDCSGSMSYDLPKIREETKRKLPKMLGEKDTLSIIWFSGRGEFGVLLEAEPVGTLTDLQQVGKAIDRWLVPVGLTGFKEPLIEAAALGDRLAKKNPQHVRSVMFFTDGCDNQWSNKDVLDAVVQTAGKVQSCTFVEYGYYANRNLLASMAQKSGGSLIFAEDFPRFEPQFENVIRRKVSGAKRVEVTLEWEPLEGFVYALVDGDLTTYEVEDKKAHVPEDLKEVFYLAAPPKTKKTAAFAENGAQIAPEAMSALYGAVSLYAVRMKPDIVYPLLKMLGDVRFIREFSGCFGKQKYSAFMDAAKGAAFDKTLRLTDGFNPDLVPREDAFTVLDILNLLQEDDTARVLLDHPDFQYSRIGRGRIDSVDQLTPEEQAKVEALTLEMNKTKDTKKIKDLMGQIQAITNKPEALKFVRKIPRTGLSVDGLTWNESRPNVSFRVKIPGEIDLSNRQDTAPKGSEIPTVFPCFVYRNYALIKDGLINVAKLPVTVSPSTYAKLVEEGVVSSTPVTGDTVTLVLDLTKVPIINRKMIKALSAKAFFETSYELTKARAAQKVYKDYAKNLLPEKTSQGFSDKYGEEGAAWLKSLGITDYNGYQPPHTIQAESKDVYMGKELDVALKGLSTLPKVTDVKAKLMKVGADGTIEWLQAPKLNATGALMADAVKEIESFLASDIYRKAADQPAVLKAWLDGQTRAAIKKTRGLIFDVAQATFCTIVGQVWFKEFSSIEENTWTLTTSAGPVACKVEMKEIQIPI